MSQDNQTLGHEAPKASRRALLFGIAAVGAVASPAVAASLLEAPKGAAVETLLSAPAPASPSPDAALFKLIDDYWIAHEEEERALKAFTPYEAKWYARRRQVLQELPEALRVRAEDPELLPMAMGHLQGVEDGFHGIHLAGGERSLSSIYYLQGDKWAISDQLSPPEDPFISATVRWEEPTPAARARADEIIEAHNKLTSRYRRRPAGYRAAKWLKDTASSAACAILEEIRSTPSQSLAGVVAKARLAHDDARDEEMALSVVDDLLALPPGPPIDEAGSPR
jgi:hypothetical protein